jgi:predicted transcriptional regulator with HTH domain
MQLFKKLTRQVSKALTPVVNTQEVIEEIHNRFDMAADEALQEANLILASLEGANTEKGELMQKLGFTATAESTRVKEQEAEKKKSNERAKIISYYQQKYPQYKFIFRDQVSDICKKYGLVCGEAARYKGDIPMKNLKEIEAFEVQEDDSYYIRDYRDNMMPSSMEYLMQGESNFVSKKEVMEKARRMKKPGDDSFRWQYRESARYIYREIPFFICAPKGDMTTDEYTKEKDGFIYQEIPDPIVLHSTKDGFLIVSKWGPEASDELVVNQKMN